MVQAQAAWGGGALVTAKRNFYSDDGVRLDFTEAAEDDNGHVDTNCWLIFKEAFGLLRFWRVALGCSWAGDRIFLQKVLNDRHPIGFTDNRTVNYRTRHADHFRQAGLPVPENAIGSEGLNAARRYASSVEGVTALAKLLGFYPRF